MITIEDKIVLVIEDDRSLLMAIGDKLKRSGLAVINARNAEQALPYMKLISVDAVWLDHNLFGEYDGLGFMEMIINDVTFETPPFFVVTNVSDLTQRDHYLALGATKYYIKSDHRLEDIVEDIKNCIN